MKLHFITSIRLLLCSALCCISIAASKHLTIESPVQAYQESGLDHNKKSPFGALGLMQIEPSTASSKRIGVPEVKDVENNVHAGVKYLALLRNHYFNDPHLPEKDRIRFSSEK